jgi:hypothetical protein
LFTKHPPNNNFHYKDPCTKQISFHHLLLEQTQRLYQAELEKNINGSGLALADIAPYFLNEDILLGTNRPGGDYTHFYEPSVKECQKKCKSDQKCLSFSHENSQCWLKSEIPTTKVSSVTSTGVVLSHYVCNKRQKKLKIKSDSMHQTDGQIIEYSQARAFKI